MIGKLECIRENSGDIANLTLSIKKGSLRSKKILSRQRGKSVEAHFIDKDELNYPNPNVPFFCLEALRYQEIAFIHFAHGTSVFVFVFPSVTLLKKKQRISDEKLA